MTKGIPWGFYQGNRSEYLAIPALSKLGFTIPVPRQEDRFGIDFIVHLANLENKSMIPLGKSFGIQIKSNKGRLSFSDKEQRECLYNMSIPFFIGVISREKLTLTIYNTLGRLCFFWKKGLNHPFEIIPESTGKGLACPDYETGKIRTGKPVLEINIKDPPKAKDRLKEIKNLHATMKDWIKLENEALSLKEQKVPLVWLPKTYETNKPFTIGERLGFVAYFNPNTLRDICVAAQKTLTSLNYYLKDCLNPQRCSLRKDLKELIQKQHEDVESVIKRNMEIIGKMNTLSKD